MLKRLGALAASAAVIATSLVTVGAGATPAAAVPFACDASTIYTQNSAGEIRSVDVSAGSGALGAAHASGQRANALGISGDGNLAFTLDNDNRSGGANKQLAIFDAATGQTQTRALGDPNVPGVLIRGAVSPTTGIYYYAGSSANSYLGAYDPSTGEAIGQVGVLATGVDGNGDFAFGANGELYVLAERDIFVVQPENVPTTASTEDVPLTRVTRLPAGTQGNGIAFGANGKLFVSQSNSISEVDLATGQMMRTISTPGFSNSDMSSCSFPNTLTVQKNIVDRFDESDQFTLDIDGETIDENHAATTTGSSTGMQPAIAGPVFVETGSTYTVSEIGAGGADLANYTSSVVCLDSSGSPVPTTGTGPSWSVVFPTVERGENVICTITNDAVEPAIPGLELRKTSDPASGSAVEPGDTITYTVEAENTGETVLNPVTVADDLSKVFEYASYQKDVTTVIDGTQVTSDPATISGDDLAWSGALDPGQTATITYSVVVNEGVEGEQLENRVTASGTPPGGGDPVVPPAVVTEHPVAGFDISKSADPASGTVVEPGDTITYTVTGSNTGATLLDPASISDDLSEVLADATYNGDALASVGDVKITGAELNWSGALAPGATVKITYSVTVVEDASSVVLNNVASGSATPLTANPADPEGPLVPGTPIVPAPVETVHPVMASAFAVSKSADPSSGSAVNAGDTVTYTVTAENTGDTVLNPVSVSDDLSAVLSSAKYNGDVKASVGTASLSETTLSWNGTLAPGASVKITYSVTVNENATGVLLQNVVEGEATPQIPEDPSDPESPTTPGDPITPPPAETEHPVVNPAFAVSKSADPASGSAVNAGDTVTYTVTAENTGDTVLNPASVSDNLAGVLSHASYNGDVLATTGNVSIVGDKLSWTGALSAGERAVITYSVTVDSDASGELLSNVAEGSATPRIPEDPSDPESPTTLGNPITPPPAETEHPVNTPGFELSKSVDPASGSAVDTGAVLRYTVTGENTGETVLDPVAIEDDLSEVLAHAKYNGDVAAAINGVPVAAPTIADEELTWSGALEVGQTVTITYSVTVGPEAAGENLVNVVTAEATPPGGDENTIVPPPVETDNPVNVPGFSVSKSADPEAGSRVDPGSVVRYTVTGVNTGETALDPVSIVDDLSGVFAHADYNGDVAASLGSATIEGDELVWNGALGIGERVSITYSVTVHGDAGGETLRNAVTGVATPPGDAAPIETPRSTTEHPVNEPGFELAKSANPATGDAVDPGSVITYTVTGVNTGQTVLSPVEITDDLSGVFAHATYNGDVTASIGEAQVSDEQLVWQGELGIGERISINYSVTVNGDAGGSTVRNTAGGEATPPGGNTITPPPVSTEHPVNAPGFTFVKSADTASGSSVAGGSIVTYTLTGVNTGETDLSDVAITDDLSRVLKYAKYQDDAVARIGEREAAAVEISGDALAWAGQLAVGETVTVTYSVRVNEDAAGQLLENVAVASAMSPGGTIDPPASATEHPVRTQLAVTGERAMPWLALGALLAAGGGALITRRRKKSVL